MGKGLAAVIIGAISTVSLTYILLKNSKNVATVAGGATKGYGEIARTFAGN